MAKTRIVFDASPEAATRWLAGSVEETWDGMPSGATVTEQYPTSFIVEFEEEHSRIYDNSPYPGKLIEHWHRLPGKFRVTVESVE